MAEGVQLQSILMGDDRIEMSWVEQRHVTRTSTRVQTLQSSTFGLEQELEDLHTAALALLDAMEVLERNPPQRVPPREA